MARAPIRTPGKAVVEETTTETEVTSTASEPVQQVNQSEQEQTTATAEEPSYEDLQAQINEMKKLLASQNQNQTSVVSEPVAPHVRTRDVIGPHGWTKEVI